MDFRELAVELLSKMQSLHKVKQKKGINEIMQGEAFVLNYVSLHNSDVLPGEISAVMDVSSARIATALNSLEKKGLIIRQIDRNNRRRILVSITPEGQERAKEQQRIMVERTTALLTLLGENDAMEYVRIMGRLIDIIPNCKE